MAAVSECKVLEEIGENLLCCTICLDQFKSPKVLPCLHTFCEQCLVTLVEKTGSLNCPECRQQYRLPVGGVSAIKSNRFIKNLIQIFKRRLQPTEVAEIQCGACEKNIATNRCVECKFYLCNDCVKAHKLYPATKIHQVTPIDKAQHETENLTSPVTLQAVEYCNVHSENKIEFYCETCQVLVCIHCITDIHRIPEHVPRNLKDAADKCLTEFKVMVDKLKVKEQEVKKNKTLVQQKQSYLIEQCRREERMVSLKAEETCQKIKSEEQRLIDELKNNYEMKIKTAAADIDVMELRHVHIKSTCSYMEALMHHGNAAQILSAKGDASSRINQLITMETEAKLDYNDVVFYTNAEFREQGILGGLKSDVCMPKCTVENVPKLLWKGDSADILITTRDSMGDRVIPKHEVKARVRKPDASWDDIDVLSNRYGTHRVTVVGQMEGKYKVTMTIGDQPIPGCPFIIPVSMGLVKTIGNQGSADGQYFKPWSVAINKDKDIVTADMNNSRLQIITQGGRFKKSLTFKKLKKPFKPCDIAISRDNVYFSLDDKNKRVVVSDEDGNVIRCFGQNELKDPYGIGISPVDGNVYVTDDGSDVKVYTQHGKYIRSFGSQGDGPGEFNRPWGIVIGNNGIAFVADYTNQRVQVFGPNDQYLHSFHCKNGLGHKVNPRGIALENDKYVYVTAEPDCLLQFDILGKFVCRIDHSNDGLALPTGIALTDDVPCRMVVADMQNHCIKVFVH